MASELQELTSEFAQGEMPDLHELDGEEVCPSCGNSGRRHVGIDPQSCQSLYEPCLCIMEGVA